MAYNYHSVSERILNDHEQFHPCDSVIAGTVLVSQ